jgi:hypothetical protein
LQFRLLVMPLGKAVKFVNALTGLPLIEASRIINQP